MQDIPGYPRIVHYTASLRHLRRLCRRCLRRYGLGGRGDGLRARGRLRARVGRELLIEVLHLGRTEHHERGVSELVALHLPREPPSAGAPFLYRPSTECQTPWYTLHRVPNSLTHYPECRTPLYTQRVKCSCINYVYRVSNALLYTLYAWFS